MKEHPIIFGGPMIKTILEGSKTMTRRPIKLKDIDENCKWCHGKGYEYIDCQNELSGYDYRRPCRCMMPRCPYGIPGDRLWVRESFWIAEMEGQGIGNQFLVYDEEMDKEPHPSKLRPTFDMKWGHNPSIHMPRWASRITLEVTEVRVKKLQQITEEDAKSEGVEIMQRPPSVGGGTQYLAPACGDRPSYWEYSASTAFMYLWETIYGKDAWDNNPWVWVISFKKL